MRRASSRPRPADLPEPAGAVSVWQDVISADGLTAITSGSMRTRRVAVQGSALRSDRALCARLAPCQSASWTIVVFGERETLTAPRRARSVGIYVMAGRVDFREGSRDVQLQAISEVQRPCVLDVQHATWQVALRLRRRVDDERAHGHDATGRNGAVDGGDFRRQPSDVRFHQ